MKRATKMMLLGNQYGKSMTRDASRDSWHGQNAWDNGDMSYMAPNRHSDAINFSMGKYFNPDGNGGFRTTGGDFRANRRIGYDANMENDYNQRRRERERYDRMEGDEEDQDHSRNWQNHRMYAAGVAWAEPGEGHKHSRKQYGELDEKCAHKWVSQMENADGTVGGHYKPEQAEQLRAAHCPQCQKWEWYVALNMMYSDYAPVGKKLGVDRDEFYAGLARAFLMDKDAGEHKLAKYMDAIPEGSEAA